MAKIENTTVYPLTTPSVDDFIIGTDTSDENRTVSFSIESITATSLLQGLQSVLNAGSIATQNISLTGNITVVGTVYPTTITAQGSTGTAGQLLSSTASGIEWVDTSVIASNTLQEVTTAGNTTTDDIVMNGGDITSTGNITMNGASQTLALSNSTGMTLAVNSDITTSGNINLSGGSSVLNFGTTAEINDSAGSTGAIGSILTVDAVGTGVEWSTGIPAASMPTLQEVLNAGNTATGIGMQFIGSSITTFSASSIIQSSANNVWSGTNEFSGNGGTPATSGINLPGSLSDGVGTGASGQVLTSTVTGVSWADLSTVGVSSVNNTTPVAAASPQTPITITPNSGAVLVRQNIYTGGSYIGCVPEGGNSSTFLRGDGLWATPTGVPAPSGFMNYLFATADTAFTSLHYYTLALNNTGTSGDRTVFTADLGITAPSSASLSDREHIAGCFLSNPTGNLCSSAYSKMKVCDMDFQFLVDAAAAGRRWEFEIWKTTRCTSGTYTLAGNVSFPSTAADTLYCGAITWTSTALQTLDPGEAFFITVKTDATVTAVDFQLNTSIRWEGVL